MSKKFKLSRSEYAEIKATIHKGIGFSCSPAVERELIEVHNIGKDKYEWRRE